MKLTVNLIILQITGLVLVIPKLETGCVITNYGVWSAQDSHAAQLLDKRGGTRVNVVLANQVCSSLFVA